MAFQAEDGSGLPGANSLASIEHADEYHELRGNVAWAAMPETERKQHLILATDYVVDVFGPALAGKAATTTQGLPFPRLGSMFVPHKVQDAVAELALISKTSPLLGAAKRGKKSVQVGPLKVEYDPAEESESRVKFPSAVLKMVPFLVSFGAGGFQAKLVRS